MATTIIRFKAIRDREVVYENIPIEHDFVVIPPCTLHCINLPELELPETTVEEQVMEMLRNTNLWDLMVEHDFDIIIDYWPYVKKTRRTKREEIAEFIEFCKPFINENPNLATPFSAIIQAQRKTLFGHGKTHIEKFEEVMTGIGIAYKAIAGAFDHIIKQFNGEEPETNLIE